MRQMRAFWGIAWVVACLLVAFPAAAEVVTMKAPDPAFSITIPDGFASYPAGNVKNTILTYRQEGITQADLGFLIQVDRLHGVLGREKIKPEDLAGQGGNVQFSLDTMQWRSFELQRARGTQSASGKQLVVFLTQVPLKPEAIQVKVAVEAKDEREGRELLEKVVASVEGETNWLSDSERVKLGAEGCTRLGIFGTVIVVIAIGTLRFLYRVFRSGPPAPVEAPKYPIQPMGPMAPQMAPIASGAPESGGRVKCPNCGLIAFASAPGTPCKRCGTPT